ncbi:hypothetical protein FB480_101870 [Agrobacterium vitis]|nr:hypothetical protein FB480_101870 [Agrobacterium vitis]
MSDLLKRTGEALYGPQWQSQIARDLDMSDRHVRRIAAGEADLRPGMAMDLWRISLERIATLEALTEELKMASTPNGT